MNVKQRLSEISEGYWLNNVYNTIIEQPGDGHEQALVNWRVIDCTVFIASGTEECIHFQSYASLDSRRGLKKFFLLVIRTNGKST